MAGQAARFLNDQAEVTRKGQALLMNITAGKGLMEVLKSNLGPRGTLKMLVSGAGDIKITKDGAVLLHEMQIQHPTAGMIARTATAQDDSTGDGTTTCVLLIGEIMKQAERYLSEGQHPRVICEGIDLAKDHCIKFVDSFAYNISDLKKSERDVLVDVARTSLRTKLRTAIADKMTEIVADSLLCIRQEGQPIDLHMVEIMHMEDKLDVDTRLVQGLVLDHGARHPDMKTRLENCYIMTCNVSLEFEKSEVNSGFYYKSADERQSMVEAEREVTNVRCQKIIDFKNSVCTEENGKSFVVVNQKGIDPISLEMLAKAGIFAARRAKRRNMERLVLACGGEAVNVVDDLKVEHLGHADLVHEQTLGDEKYTFIEGVQNPHSCTIMVKGPNKHTIAQIKDGIRDGLRAVKNVMEDKRVIPGGGAFQIAAHADLMEFKKTVQGRAKMGVDTFADALLIIPKCLASNSGLDCQTELINMQEEHVKGNNFGLKVDGGGLMDPAEDGIWDNYRVIRQALYGSATIASQLLLVDEVMRAGKQMKGGRNQG